jgi:hypothetical protein
LECIYDLIDPQFDALSAFSYRMSVLFRTDGFSCLISHADSQRALRLTEYRFPVPDGGRGGTGFGPPEGSRSLVKLSEFFRKLPQCSRTDIAYAVHRFTVAPAAYMKGDAARRILSGVHSLYDEDSVVTDTLIPEGPVVAAAIPARIMTGFEALLPGCVHHSSAFAFARGVLNDHTRQSDRRIFVQIFQDYFEMTVVQGTRLLYLNSFRYAAPADILYYLVFVLEQLGFVPSEEEITLAGEISPDSQIYSDMKTYCGSLRFASARDGFFMRDAENIPVHRHFTLLSLSLCE